MRLSISMLAALSALILFNAGCQGPERKFGRGMLNITEFARMGEIRRSMEQTALWENTDASYTTGFMHGLNRSLARTAVGAYEIVTAPLPPYDPVFLPEYPVYPDSYRPRLIADPTFGPDAALGFRGGYVSPMGQGSRFGFFVF